MAGRKRNTPGVLVNVKYPAIAANGPAQYLSDRIDPNNQKSVLQALVVDGEDHTGDWSISDFTLHELRTLFMSKLDVDEEIADILIEEGFTSLEEVAYVPLQEMLEIEAFDEDTVNELRARAKDALLTMEIAREESVEETSLDLRDLEGMTPDLLAKLAQGGVHTRDELADLATDELVEMTGQTEDEATALIMKAREHWFDQDQA